MSNEAILKEQLAVVTEERDSYKQKLDTLLGAAGMNLISSVISGHLKSHENYIEWQLFTGEGRKFIVGAKWEEGKSPATMAAEWKAAHAEIVKRNEQAYVKIETLLALCGNEADTSPLSLWSQEEVRKALEEIKKVLDLTPSVVVSA
jgi:hypothetical protein